MTDIQTQRDALLDDFLARARKKNPAVDRVALGTWAGSECVFKCVANIYISGVCCAGFDDESLDAAIDKALTRLPAGRGEPDLAAILGLNVEPRP